MLDSLLARGCRIDSVRIVGWASPEADTERNQMLSHLRAKHLRDRLVSLYPLLADHVSVVGMGENWEPIRDYLTEASDNVISAYRDELLLCLDEIESDQARENALVRVGRGKPWRKIVEQACPKARYAEARIDFCPDPVEVAAVLLPDTSALPATPPADTLTVPVVPEPAGPEYTMVTERDWHWAVRTNLLVPAANIGVVWPIGRHFSLAADWYYPWIWPPRRNAWCVELLGLGVEGRWWLRDGADPYHRLTGSSLGCTVMAGYYDFEARNRGLQGEYLQVSLDYGWTFPIFRDRCRLTLLAGACYLHSNFRTYAVHEPYGRLYRDGDWTDKLNWFGPTRLEVSLAIPIWHEQTIKQEVWP